MIKSLLNKKYIWKENQNVEHIISHCMINWVVQPIQMEFEVLFIQNVKFRRKS